MRLNLILVNHGLLRDQVTNIPNFVPPIDIEPTGNDYFLYFGRLSPEKGISHLLHAFAKLGKGRLIIAGDGPDRESLESTARRINLTDVEFVGHQSQDSIFKLIAGCLAAVVPSICWEVFGLTITETMAIGKPVIASNTGGIPEQAEHGKTGLLFSPGNVDELSAYMNKLFNDREMADEMGKMGKQKALKMYSPETHYKNILNVYQEVIDNKNNMGIGEADKELVTAAKTIG